VGNPPTCWRADSVCRSCRLAVVALLRWRAYVWPPFPRSPAACLWGSLRRSATFYTLTAAEAGWALVASPGQPGTVLVCALDSDSVLQCFWQRCFRCLLLLLGAAPWLVAHRPGGAAAGCADELLCQVGKTAVPTNWLASIVRVGVFRGSMIQDCAPGLGIGPGGN